MINLLYVLHDTNLGGATQSLIDLLRVLRKKVNARVIVPFDGPACSILTDLGVPYYIFPFEAGYGPLGSNSSIDKEFNFWINYSVAEEIVKYAVSDKWNIDLIHSNSSVTNIGAILSLLLNVKHIWHYREFLEEDFGMQFYDKELQYELTRASDYCIAISDCIKEKYEKEIGKEFNRKYNGLNVKKYYFDYKGINRNNNFYIAGNVSEGKGQADAVKAIEYLVNYCGIDDITLFIVGYGDERLIWLLKKFIEYKHIEKNVVITPFQNDLSDLRKNCSFSLTCSRMEALGRTTIEAMMAGNLVIGANSGATIEIVGSNEERGLLYNVGDFVSLAKTMKRAISLNDSEMDSYLKNAQEFTLETFDSNKYADDIFELYKNVSSDNIKVDEKVKQNLLVKLKNKYENINISELYYKKYKKRSDKWISMFSVCNRWINNKINNVNIANILEKYGIKTVAVYGMGYLGRSLYDDLKKSNITVKYFIDLNYSDNIEPIKIYKPNGDLPKVDCIIVTVVGSEQEIINQYSKMIDIPIMGISQIINNGYT